MRCFLPAVPVFCVLYSSHLSNGHNVHNKVPICPFLRTEIDPVPETLFFFWYLELWMMDKAQKHSNSE